MYESYFINCIIPGEGLVNYTLNTTGNTPPKLYLFLIEDWREALEEVDCQDKLSKARAICK